jgi:glycosyltransferase involved in cell wall biosynthesis
VGIRVVVVDDNPHVSWQGQVYPVNATFHRFLSAVLDVPGAPVTSIVHCVPLRAASAPPATLPLDPRLEVVGTAPFDGIGGYLRHAPSLVRQNARTLRPVIASADLVWIKTPASNALLAGWLALTAGVPRFGYVAGSALAVARGRGLGLPSQAVGFAYDLAGRVAGGRQRVVVGEGLIGDGGIVTSLVEPEEIRDVSNAPWPADPSRLRLAWAGRLAPGKGLEVLLDALGILAAGGEAGGRAELIILGDGPARPDLEARAARRGVADRIRWLGYVADRATYMDALAACDLFVSPSPAEGFPKVILDAMAIGLPVVATPTGHIAAIGTGRFEPIRFSNAVAIADSIRSLMADPDRVKGIRTAAGLVATRHTSPAEAARLVARWRRDFPTLPWPDRC